MSLNGNPIKNWMIEAAIEGRFEDVPEEYRESLKEKYQDKKATIAPLEPHPTKFMKDLKDDSPKEDE